MADHGSFDTSGYVIPSMVTPSQIQLVLQIMLNRDLATHKNRPMLEVHACCKICKVYEKETKVNNSLVFHVFSKQNYRAT